MDYRTGPAISYFHYIYIYMCVCIYIYVYINSKWKDEKVYMENLN